METGKRCTKCKKLITKKKFASNQFTEDGLDMYCNDCRKESVKDLESLQDYCEQNGRPFQFDIWDKAIDELKKKLAPTLKGLPLEAKEKMIIQKAIVIYFSRMNLKVKAQTVADKMYGYTPKNNNDLGVDEALIEKWGAGYTPKEYELFEKKYERLSRSYSEKTEMHREALLTYIRYRVREEICTANNNIREAKEWATLASKQALDAKINPSQMSKSDISGGIDVIGQLFEAVESEVGIIPLLPKLLEQPYDDADMIIWCIVNYMRRLEEKTPVSYREVYSFYDEMLREHYKQNGWNQEQIEIFLKKRNNVFRDMEQVYFEPIYQKHESLDNEE